MNSYKIFYRFRHSYVDTSVGMVGRTHIPRTGDGLMSLQFPRSAHESSSSHVLLMTSSNNIWEVVPDSQYNLTKHKSTKAPVIIPDPWRADHIGCSTDGTHFCSYGTFRSDSIFYYVSVILSVKQSF